MNIEICKEEQKICCGDIVICDDNDVYMLVKTLKMGNRCTLLNLKDMFISDDSYGTFDDLLKNYFSKDTYKIVKSNDVTLKLNNGGIKYELSN